jgi:hypothetical protein
MKPSTWDVMKQAKKDPIEQNPAFDKLKGFGTIDIGGIEEAMSDSTKLGKILTNVANKYGISKNQVKKIIANS